ncbi:hypothetical protein [Vibrio sp. SCSIO 43137]|uniref:hypothetical protein n=1 Tax=Vibrio sp. SCSIO 43137 TaxID=3021011 RepID=UPI0023080FDC|nr:hypothetical protein [Vibrio sp. SCSIO 43137]WCE30064.1 hypothetical protein PK654_01820 [Vibrio sp. SCSIO 43137]
MQQVITAVKKLAPVNQREYITLIWAIVEHTAIQSLKGREEQNSILMDIREYVDLLNQKYPIEQDTERQCENSRLL